VTPGGGGSESGDDVSVSFEVSDVSGVVVTVASSVLGPRSDSTGTVVGGRRDAALSVEELDSTDVIKVEAAGPERGESLYSSGGAAAGAPPSPPLSPIRPAGASVGPGSVSAVLPTAEVSGPPKFATIETEFLGCRERFRSDPRSSAVRLCLLLPQIKALLDVGTLDEGALGALKRYERYINEFICPVVVFFTMINSLCTDPRESKRIAEELIDKKNGQMQRALEYCVRGRFLSGFEMSQVFYWPTVADRIVKLDLAKFTDDESKRRAADEVLDRAIQYIESGQIDKAKALWEEMSLFLQMIQGSKDPANRDLRMSTIYLKYMRPNEYQCSDGSAFVDELFEWIQTAKLPKVIPSSNDKERFLVGSGINIATTRMNMSLKTDFQAFASKYGISIQVRRVLGDGKAATCVDIKSPHSDAPTLILEHGYDGQFKFRIRNDEQAADQSFVRDDSFVTACDESFALETSFTDKETQPPADE
jgi:hypothetical protein